jgi:N-acylneuraminate cytidylyltransferase
MLVGLLPMKGNSERVPGKNLRPIAGKPLFAWVTEAMLAATGVDRVVVDTDSDEIEERVNQSFGREVEVVRRPQHLIGDLVPMHDIVANLCATLDGDDFLQTHSTNPLLTSETIEEATAAYYSRSEGYDSLMGVTARHTRFYWEDGRPVNHDPAVLLRTQDLPPLLEENSNVYIAPRTVIEATGRRVGSSPVLFPIDAAEALDIDEELDFAMAAFLLEARRG